MSPLQWQWKQHGIPVVLEVVAGHQILFCQLLLKMLSYQQNFYSIYLRGKPNLFTTTLFRCVQSHEDLTIFFCIFTTLYLFHILKMFYIIRQKKVSFCIFSVCVNLNEHIWITLFFLPTPFLWICLYHFFFWFFSK